MSTSIIQMKYLRRIFGQFHFHYIFGYNQIHHHDYMEVHILRPATEYKSLFHIVTASSRQTKPKEFGMTFIIHRSKVDLEVSLFLSQVF